MTDTTLTPDQLAVFRERLRLRRANGFIRFSSSIDDLAALLDMAEQGQQAVAENEVIRADARALLARIRPRYEDEEIASPEEILDALNGDPR